MRLVERIEQHVGRLQVAVQNPVLMRVVYRCGYDFEVTSGALRGQRDAAHELFQVLPCDVLHRKVMLPLMCADLMNGNDIRVLKAGHCLSLDAETPYHVFTGELPEKEHFDGNDPVEADLPGFINDAHAAPADFAEQFVITEIANGAIFRRRVFIPWR